MCKVVVKWTTSIPHALEINLAWHSKMDIMTQSTDKQFFCQLSGCHTPIGVTYWSRSAFSADNRLNACWWVLNLARPNHYDVKSTSGQADPLLFFGARAHKSISICMVSGWMLAQICNDWAKLIIDYLDIRCVLRQRACPAGDDCGCQ